VSAAQQKLSVESITPPPARALDLVANWRQVMCSSSAARVWNSAGAVEPQAKNCASDAIEVASSQDRRREVRLDARAPARTPDVLREGLDAEQLAGSEHDRPPMSSRARGCCLATGAARAGSRPPAKPGTSCRARTRTCDEVIDEEGDVPRAARGAPAAEWDDVEPGRRGLRGGSLLPRLLEVAIRRCDERTSP